MRTSIVFVGITVISMLYINSAFGRNSGNSITNRLDYVLQEVFLKVPEKPGKVREKDPPDAAESGDVGDDQGTFVDYYLVGNTAYLQNDYSICSYFFEKAIMEYRDYANVVATCRIGCVYETNDGKPLYEENPENLHFFDWIVRKTLCLKKCLFRDLPKKYRFFEVNDAFREIFHSRKPYEYLQLCHYKNNEIEKAVAAAATVLAMFPEHKLSLSNLKYYTTLPEFHVDFLKDEEAKKFVAFYQKGMDLYRESRWMESIEQLEMSLKMFLREENMCRAFCEGSFNQGWYPDFITSTANHFTYSLRCKKNCTIDMSIVGTQKYPDVLPSHYEYLQFAYFNVGNIEEAIKCTVTYLMFFPDNQMMQENLNFYRNHPEAKEEFFIERNEALEYYQRARYEKSLMQFINEEFAKSVVEINTKDEKTQNI
ncbi:prolyl 3-hydroxylase 1-like [Lutzomyia longipalpis]|uniref:prolyl 3-hydroxylase 1-like n=1 Tax=Lutzomyia longipalpis TaxID=7200 RepID=UPI002483BFBD|nr:prolyl 3-hydroxylase 1-like [Lutzomyia longipalpis]XP_055693370.1 prolyl 3-hydroxylase 1-like [Lutzomyia longipalpis]